ncbi:MAG: Ni,Fe-hydrogenase maturation factor [Deltaproteobacteria bacterium]|nr:Ni,Fe-hydrogenase maturation factor [Deltaproteobacteria bacterium]
MLTPDVIELLKPESSGPLLVITVGNRLRSDDGVAPYIAEQAKRPKNGIIILDAGERPEDMLWKAIEVRPERVVIIDAADFAGEPGEVRTIPEEFIPENPISTHRFPLRVISRLVTEDTGAMVDFICIQPESVGFGEGLSDRVRSSAEEIVRLLSARE